MWTLIEPSTGSAGRPARTTPAVVNHNNIACVILPGSMAQASRVDIYNDGTRLGLMFHDKGRYKVIKAGKTGLCRVTVPAPFVKMLPKGTTDAVVANDGAMVVIDLAQFNAMAVAAE